MTATVHDLPNQVERKVHALRGSGVPAPHLREACVVTLAQNLPLRDAIVLREARRLAGSMTPDVLAAWVEARRTLRHSLPPSTYRLWIKPLRPLSAEGDTLRLTAPEGIRAWTARRYGHLIREALAGTGFTNASLAQTIRDSLEAR